MTRVTNIKRAKPVAPKEIARIIPVQIIEPMPAPILDFATRERKAFIQSVSPFLFPHERYAYFKRMLLALVFGLPMPHEVRV